MAVNRIASNVPYVPTYQSGIAQCRGDSIKPNHWNGLVESWPIFAGPTKDVARNFVSKKHGVLTSMDFGSDWVVGPKGYALDFDGVADSTGDRILCPLSTGTKKMSGWTMSIEFIFRYLGGSTQQVNPFISKYGVAGTDRSFYLILNRRASDIILNGLVITDRATAPHPRENIAWQPSPDPEDALWHHVVFTMDLRVAGGSAYKLFWDGVELSQTSWSEASSPVRPMDLGGPIGWEIGGQAVNGTWKFQGQFSLVNIYNRALSDSECIEKSIDPYAMFSPSWNIDILSKSVLAATRVQDMIGMGMVPFAR